MPVPTCWLSSLTPSSKESPSNFFLVESCTFLEMEPATRSNFMAVRSYEGHEHQQHSPMHGTLGVIHARSDVQLGYHTSVPESEWSPPHHESWKGYLRPHLC